MKMYFKNTEESSLIYCVEISTQERIKIFYNADSNYRQSIYWSESIRDDMIRGDEYCREVFKFLLELTSEEIASLILKRLK